MSWSRRIFRSRAFQVPVAVVARQYLRLVWRTSSFMTEPADIYERAAREDPVILPCGDGQHLLGRCKTGRARQRSSSRAIAMAKINAIAAEWVDVNDRNTETWGAASSARAVSALSRKCWLPCRKATTSRSPPTFPRSLGLWASGDQACQHFRAPGTDQLAVTETPAGDQDLGPDCHQPPVHAWCRRCRRACSRPGGRGCKRS